MRTLLLSLCLSYAAWCQGLPPEKIPSPRPAGWIVDRADVLSAEQETRLNQQLTALERDTSAEMAIVTLPDTDGRDPKLYATALFNHWGIGKRGKDNGVLFLVIMGRRRMEVEVGDGLSTPIRSSWVPGMLTAVVVPEFRRGAPGVGIEKGIEQLVARVPRPVTPVARLRHTLGPLWSAAQVSKLQARCDAERVELVVEKHAAPTVALAQKRFAALKLKPQGCLVLFAPQTGTVALFAGSEAQVGDLPPVVLGKAPPERAAALCNVLLKHLQRAETAPVAPPQPLAAPVNRRAPSHEGEPVPGPWVLLLGLPGFPALYFWAKYRRQRTCPGCGQRLALVNEAQDDAHLSPEENLEENLGSIDHMVWTCSGCDFTKKEPWNAWLSGYSACPQCMRRTTATESRTLRAATYDHSGQGLRIRDCRNCGFHDESTYSIPRKTRSSSSSSSSSGSSSSGFGGGRSSGGGGGASW